MDAYVLAGHAVDSGTESQRGDQQYTLKTLRCSKSCYHMFTHGVHDAHDSHHSCGDHKHLKGRSEEHTSELQSRGHLVCRLLLEQKKAPATQPRRGHHVAQHRLVAHTL